MQQTDSAAGGLPRGAELVATIQSALRAVADPVRAPQMQAYMKSSMPYLGVPVPATRRLTQQAAAACPPTDLADLIGAATLLWRSAEFREERYAATEIAGLRLATGR